MLGIFREVTNRSVVIPSINLTNNTCTLSVYETASTLHLLVEYIDNSLQKCFHYGLGKDGLSEESSSIFFSDRALATILVINRLKLFRDEAEQSIELVVDKTQLETFFLVMFKKELITMGDILGEKPSADIRIKFTIEGIENAFKSIGSPIEFKEPAKSSCTIS